MLTRMSPADLARQPVSALATCAAPARWHEALRSLGVHDQDGAWIVARPDDVAAALASASLKVARPPGDGGPADALLGRMARFSDGPPHQLRRELAAGALPPLPDVVMAAEILTRNWVRSHVTPFDIMPMARALPVTALASAMGLAPGPAERAAELTGRLSDAVSPTLGRRTVAPGVADEAAVELCALLPGAGWRRDEDGADEAGAAEAAAGAASVLFQARDATAALIGLTVLAGIAGSDQRVEEVLRHDAPVQCTRRTVTADTVIGDVTLPPGAAVWIFVAAAERGGGTPAAFGSGPHACPGAAHAIAIARQVVAVLEAEGWRPAVGQRIEFEPRPNIRLPRQVLVSRP